MGIRQLAGFLALVALLACGRQSAAAVKAAPVFGDHMVLQQGVAVPVWGTADPGEKVTVKFRGQEVAVTADDAGKWTARLPAMKAEAKQAGTPLVISGKASVTFRDVLVGEVWLCSGQSNMQWSLSSS